MDTRWSITTAQMFKPMVLCALSDDALGVVCDGLCDALEPHVAVDFTSACRGVREPTRAQRRQLRADYEAATALCHKAGVRSCKELREATGFYWHNKGLTAADLATLGTLGSLLPALEQLVLFESTDAAGSDGVQQLAEKLGVGSLPAVTCLSIFMQVGGSGASALADAFGRGALARLEVVDLCHAGIGDADLVALAPALWQLPALETLALRGNPLGDEGLVALVAPPPPGVLTKLESLDLRYTQVADAGCAALASALDSGVLPAIMYLNLAGGPASAVAKASLREALANSRAAVSSIRV